MLRRLHFFQLVFVVTCGAANTATADDCRNQTKVYYVNGLATPERATEEALSLEAVLEGTSISPECYQLPVQPQFNFNRIIFERILDMKDALGMSETDFWEKMDYTSKELENFDELILSAVPSDLSQYIVESNLRANLEHYKDDIAKGYNVLVVAHSFGNLYAKMAAMSLSEGERRCFHTVSVGTPVPPWADRSRASYTNVKGDFVEKLGAPAPTVTSSPGCSSGWACHSLVESYLAGDYSKPEVIGHLNKALLGCSDGPSISYRCTNEALVRTIEIVVADEARQVPCDVVYSRETEAPGVREITHHADHDPTVCERGARELAEKLHREWGWDCVAGR